jgi:hypothetical protein
VCILLGRPGVQKSNHRHRRLLQPLPRAATRPRHCRASLRIFVVRSGLPCDPPVGGHPCKRRHDTTFSSPNLAAPEGGYISIGNRRQIGGNDGGSRPFTREPWLVSLDLKPGSQDI